MDIVSVSEGGRTYALTATSADDGALLLESRDSADVIAGLAVGAHGNRKLAIAAAELPKLHAALRTKVGADGDLPALLAQAFAPARFEARGELIAFLEASTIAFSYVADGSAPAVTHTPPMVAAAPRVVPRGRLTRYTVRTADGELTYNSIHELRAMFQQGLVEPTDEVRAEGTDIWRKAEAIPELRALEVAKKDGGHFMFAAVSLCCLSGSLYALVHFHSFIVAAALMLPVIGMSTRAFTKSIKRERS